MNVKLLNYKAWENILRKFERQPSIDLAFRGYLRCKSKRI